MGLCIHACVRSSLCACLCVFVFIGSFLPPGTDGGCSHGYASHLLKVHFIGALKLSDDASGSPQRNHNNINVPAGEQKRSDNKPAGEQSLSNYSCTLLPLRQTVTQFPGPHLTGVRFSSDGRMMVTVVSVSRVWSISGRRMVIGGEVLAEMRCRRPPMFPSGAVILKS